MVLFVLYMLAIAGILWYLLGYLRIEPLLQNPGFALNVIQLGFLSLISFMVFRTEKHFRSIFFQFWILFALFASTTFVYYFIEQTYGNSAAIIAYILSLVLVPTIFAIAVANIFFTYFFRDEKRWAVNTLTFAVVLPLSVWLFWPYCFFPQEIYEFSKANPDVFFFQPLQKPAIILNVFSLVMLLAFFLHKYKTDRPIGAYIDSLLFIFSMYCAVDTFEKIAEATSLELMNMTQWVTAILLASMIVALILRLKYKSQTISDYYESQLLSVNPAIDQRISYYDRIILWCFFDTKKIGQRIFLGTGRSEMKVKRTSVKVNRQNS